MKIDPEGPADTRMMGIVHGALRRDLYRARLVLEAGEVSAERRDALATHLLWMMDFLHHHHHGEDVGLYPMLLERDPSSAAILAEMDGEHRRVEPAVDALVEAAREPEAGTLLAAVRGLEEVLVPHLHREESELMPLVSAAITEREWSAWTQQMKEDGAAGLPELAHEAHWMLDGLQGEDRTVLLHMVPAVPRFVLLHLLGGPYKRKHALLWGGTAAADVGSLDLAATAALS